MHVLESTLDQQKGETMFNKNEVSDDLPDSQIFVIGLVQGILGLVLSLTAVFFALMVTWALGTYLSLAGWQIFIAAMGATTLTIRTLSQ